MDNANSLIIARQRSASVEHRYLHEDLRSAPHKDFRYRDRSTCPRRRQLPSLERLDSPLPLTESLEKIHLWSRQKTSAEYYNEQVRTHRLNDPRSKEYLYLYEGFKRYSTPSLSPGSPPTPSYMREWITPSPRYYREDFYLPGRSLKPKYLDARRRRASSEERSVILTPSSDWSLSSAYLFRRLSEDLSLLNPVTEPQHPYVRNWRTSSDIQRYKEQRSVAQLPTPNRAVSSDHLLNRRSSGVKFYPNCNKN